MYYISEMYIMYGMSSGMERLFVRHMHWSATNDRTGIKTSSQYLSQLCGTPIILYCSCNNVVVDYYQVQLQIGCTAIVSRERIGTHWKLQRLPMTITNSLFILQKDWTV